MEGLFEANRIAEVSLAKLSSGRTSGRPLRRSLLISQVLNTAQEVATEAHATLLSRSPLQVISKRSSSKLLANFVPNPDIDVLPVTSRACLPGSLPARPKSPISMDQLTSCDSSQDTIKADEEAMDFENMNSVLSNILQDSEPQVCGAPSLPQVSHVQDVLDPWLTTDAHRCWEEEICRIPRQLSPGKRNHHQAFPILGQCELPNKGLCEDIKRFKPSSREGDTLESVPGFCAYLSSSNLQTAPLITYMFGRGFSEPSNQSSVGSWPDKEELVQHTSTHPILAF